MERLGPEGLRDVDVAEKRLLKDGIKVFSERETDKYGDHGAGLCPPPKRFAKSLQVSTRTPWIPLSHLQPV